ncbi:nucleoplasmin-like protein [Bradysia coprophila]|uniref:nucleoplasmin-like protein n=1 Tax=Bradysia coprophila TaxID=38358 RepID=UPI00187D7D74|nr:nucleoplasmin-like protein [Bradysia coprophila]
MEGEYFYGAVLGEPKATTTWNSSENGEEEQSPLFKLVVKQILLGQNAPVDEYNVIEVKTTSANGPVQIPIAVLKAGEARTSIVNLEFPEAPVTFTLIEGSGPVYIHGNIISTYMEQVEDEGDECMESVEEEQHEEDNKKRKIDENGSKAANGSNSQKNSKKQKTG